MDDRYSAEAIQQDLRYSAETNERLDHWWDRAHQADHRQWLSGTTGPEVWARLDVDSLLKPGAEILNIGVGLGVCTRGLSARGCKVSVLDISSIAIERVKDVATGYLASDLPSLPSNGFDAALSHLVAQHMLDGDLEDQIRHVLRSLKPDGLLAMQYAIHKFGVAPDAEQSVVDVKGGSICRTEESFNALVERAGGKVVRTLERESHPCGIIWRVAHIRRI
jgi:SAM-dependent methyltransferase